jgi:hypothetical protein
MGCALGTIVSSAFTTAPMRSAGWQPSHDNRPRRLQPQYNRPARPPPELTSRWRGGAAEGHLQGGHGRETGRRWRGGSREKWLYFSYTHAGVVCHGLAAWTLWYLGYPDQGLAQQSAHPFSLVCALGDTGTFHRLRREGRAAQERAEATIALATEQEFPYWKARGAVLRGWALVHQGQAQDGSRRSTKA